MHLHFMSFTLFRGLLQEGLADVLLNRFGPAWSAGIALLAASLVFGLLHPITWLYAVLCFAVGLCPDLFLPKARRWQP